MLLLVVLVRVLLTYYMNPKGTLMILNRVITNINPLNSSEHVKLTSRGRFKGTVNVFLSEPSINKIYMHGFQPFI